MRKRSLLQKYSTLTPLRHSRMFLAGIQPRCFPCGWIPAKSLRE